MGITQRGQTTTGLSLRINHPNFAITYWATILFHLSAGLGQILGPDSMFDSGVADIVYLVPRQAWGAAQVAIAAGLYLGLRRGNWDICKVAMAFGTTFCVFRVLILFVALLAGEGGLVGIPAFAYIAAIHVAQTREPPENPASR